MGKSTVDLKFGREAFGGDPAGYHAIRPVYPDWVFEMLLERGCLGKDAATFEIGAGTGIATQRLVEFGANPLLVIEPDKRMAGFISDTIQSDSLSIMSASFEDAVLPENSFDFGFSATAFHWLNEDVALTKIAGLLRPGGWWAMVSNVFGDPKRHDPFHEATRELLEGPQSPADGVGNIPFALDVESRLAALERTNAFEAIECRSTEWPWVLDAGQTVALYATFSNIIIRPDRDALLAGLHRVATEQFGGRVTRNMATIVYLARRREK
ncbi:class I SAM-dependent methyltransferase [Mucilaginibacter flavidus]|uniref:class I SAM-dependent methyltransferase n=1 Tax=Mucilaginibacter flavidus TaxID=2949309 RepID=UPI002092B229|nr:class I SAM-dependent methyltransferase [Mucilaginibacter flavidus]MCO5945317.1 class I SAM-dependent methyltransferase [Mucilaginibacter flavidus]